MNEEQTKRLTEAAEALIQATDALDEAREAARSERLESASDRERTTAFQLLGSRIDAAGRRIDDALRRAATASVGLGRTGSWKPYREAVLRVREARAKARATPDTDDPAARRATAEASIAAMEDGVATAAGMVFGPDS